ncbi:hypothetical protein B0H14DRAFT_3704854 [Mycena olivaceomarginata]|nr:hypothetical protein B0H14DRAFT_3704854 [Mycena olivaceomarginata]
MDTCFMSSSAPTELWAVDWSQLMAFSLGLLVASLTALFCTCLLLLRTAYGRHWPSWKSLLFISLRPCRPPNFLPQHASNDPEDPPETFLNCPNGRKSSAAANQARAELPKTSGPQVIPVIDLAPSPPSHPAVGKMSTHAAVIDDRDPLIQYAGSWTEVGAAEEFDSTRKCLGGGGSDGDGPLRRERYWAGTSITVYGTVAASNPTSQPIWSFAVDGPVMSTYTPARYIRRVPPGALDVAVLVHRERLAPARGHADARARMVPVG